MRPPCIVSSGRAGRLRRRKGPRKAPCETPTELLDGVAGPAKLDLPVLRSLRGRRRVCFKRRHFDRVLHAGQLTLTMILEVVPGSDAQAARASGTSTSA